MKKIRIPRKNTQRKEYIMSDNEILEIGATYQHARGDTYIVLNLANEDSCYEKPVIIYKACRDNSLWVKSHEEFTGEIVSGVKRFTKISK